MSKLKDNLDDFDFGTPMLAGLLGAEYDGRSKGQKKRDKKRKSVTTPLDGKPAGSTGAV